jgi:ankyrin repeat protein
VADDEQALIELATKIFGFARGGRTAELVAYLDAGTPVNLANDRGDTLIMLAAYHGNAETVRALLEHGADPDQANDAGQTPLAGAVFKGENEVVAALVEGGADPNAGAPSAVEAARMFGQDDLLGLLQG